MRSKTTWHEFAWGVFLYGSLGGDSSYEKLFSETRFIGLLSQSPNTLGTQEVSDHLIHFLNIWKTRIAGSCASPLHRAIVKCHPMYAALKDMTIAAVEWPAMVHVSGSPMTVSDAVVGCYDYLNNVKGIGPTATAKTLHILQPNLFVMWDRPIREHFAETNPETDKTGAGYLEFLKAAQTIAKDVSDSFREARPTPRRPGQTIEGYLSDQLRYPKSLAKYVDEYLWVKITKNVLLPPKWHPGQSDNSLELNA